MREVHVTTLLCCALMGGCQTVDVSAYPAQWPKPGALTGCRITGTYKDVGELRAMHITGPDRQQRTGLIALLRDSGEVPADSSSRLVHVWLDSTAPRMQTDSEPSVEAEPLHPLGGVVCASDGSLTLSFESNMTEYSRRRTEVTVWSATDGALVVKVRWTFTSRGFPPLPSSHRDGWMRFERVAP